MSNFDELRNIADGFLGQYPEDQAWNGSSFNWMRRLPPGSKNVVGRSMLASLLLQNGLTATLSSKRQLRVNGNGISFKMAMMWQVGIVKFQNIRGDLDFDFLFCLALYPTKAFGWLIPKEELWKDGKFNTAHAGLDDQHGGADAWIDIDPTNPAAWLAPYGGTIEQAIATAKKSL
jgi:hypothetical protein